MKNWELARKYVESTYKSYTRMLMSAFEDAAEKGLNYPTEDQERRCEVQYAHFLAELHAMCFAYGKSSEHVIRYLRKRYPITIR